MQRSHVQILIVGVALSVVGSVVLQAVEFADGTGTQNDPYQIATVEQLLLVGVPGPAVSTRGGGTSVPYLQHGHFVLLDDIDLDPNLSPDYVLCRPLLEQFSGVFDGNGFCICHLAIEGMDGGNLGLFGVIEKGGVVRRLVLEGVRIHQYSGSGWTGAVCGTLNGIVSRCSVVGAVTGRSDVGGLVGLNQGVVEECRSACTLSVEYGAGGLVCTNRGLVLDCHASGWVSSSSGTVGGLVADNQYGGIHRCYSVCRVDREEGSFAGGIVGFASACSAVPVIRDCYFLDPCDGGGPNNGFGTALTDAQMRERVSFVGWRFGEPANGYSGAWFMRENGYPELAWLVYEPVPNVNGLPIEEARGTIEEAGFSVGEVVYDYDHAVANGLAVTTRPYRGAPAGATVDITVSLGSYDWSANSDAGSVRSSYEIVTPGQLDCLAYQPELWWGNHFRLVNDLDMTGRLYGRSLLGDDDDWYDPGFNGVFDGNGHVIRNLTIEVNPADSWGPATTGLFGVTGSSTCIEDLGLADVRIQGLRSSVASAGMLCGINKGYIGRCYCRGTLQWSGRLGGLAGDNLGMIRDCYVEGDIRDIYVYEYEGAYGGLVGHNSSGAVSRSYAACLGLPPSGAGLVGPGSYGLVERSLWDAEISRTSTSDGGVGLSTSELKDVRVLRDQGWGGSLYWIVDDGKDYPRLIWEGTPGIHIPDTSQGW